MPVEPLVALKDITKTYGPTVANNRISLAIGSGEIVGLVGGNGAGKSTLMRMLCGETSPDSGSIIFAGNATAEESYDTSAAQKRGIRIVHQELSLCDNLTVAENFYLESPQRTYPVPGWRKRYRRLSRNALDTVFPGNTISADAQVADLSISERQMTEIARALTAPGGKIVILDEPTSSLTLDRSQQLRQYVADQAREGRTFVFISHKLQEIMDVCGRTVVMRNGAIVWEDATENASENMLVSLMGGDAQLRSKKGRQNTEHSEPGETLVYLVGSRTGDQTEYISLKAGEIVGLAGLEGNGQRELLHSIFQPSGKSGVRLKNGITAGFVSGDRQQEGIFPLWDVRKNISISRIVKRFGLSLVNWKKDEEVVTAAAGRIRLDANRFQSGIGELSGGNQQKAMVARALACNTEIVLLDDPTRGVDVAAKQDFYATIEDIAQSGKLVIWHSTEDVEFLECNRVLVFANGVITQALSADEISESAIVDASFEHAKQQAGSVGNEASGGRTKLAQRLVTAAPFISLLAVLGAMAWANPMSMTSFGLNLLLFPAVALTLVALGQMFVIGGSEIDLGAGAFAALVNVLASTILVSSPFLGMVAIIGVLAAYSGLGAFIQVRRIPAIVVTLGASFVWIGIGYAIQPAPGGSSPAWLTSISSVTVPLVPTPIIFIVIFSLVAALVNRSPVGVALRGFGNNPLAMVRSGWSQVGYASIRYFVAGLFLLAAGLLLTSINGASDINSGNSFTLLSVAAVVIGGSTLFGGRIFPVGVAAGAVALSLIGGLLVMLNVKSDYNAAVQGLLLLLILAFRAVAAHGQEEE